MRVQTRGAHHRSVLKVVAKVIQAQSGPLRLPDLADFAGYSRTHLTRMFSHALGETPAALTRRLRLERAAHALRSEDKTVTELASESGFSGPEAFARAFRHAFGCSPTEFARSTLDWKIKPESGLHWCPSSNDIVIEAEHSKLGYKSLIIRRRATRFALYRVVGPYCEMGPKWDELTELLGGPPRDIQAREIVQIYHDNHKWVPHNKCRGDIGFSLFPGEEAPSFMTERALPAGPYVVTSDWLPLELKGLVWSELNAGWIPRYGKRPKNIPAVDMFDRWEREGRRAKVMIGLEVEMGEP